MSTWVCAYIKYISSLFKVNASASDVKRCDVCSHVLRMMFS
nr:MAG TPA: hypothetical protein [Caudoviricetes sp.]